MPNTYTSSGTAVASGAYATLAELRADPTLKLAAGETADDTLLSALLSAVQALIDAHTGRTFAAAIDTTRNFDAVRDVDGPLLLLTDDLAAITSVVNGDAVTVAANEYTTEPRNRTPYYALRLLGSSGKSWTYTEDYEDAIAVTGKWAYSTSAPADIKRACILGAAALYRQSLSGDADRPILAGGGVVIQPSQLPASFWALLRPYVRQV